MAVSKGYYEYISEMLDGIDGITYKKMMGEYIVYLYGRTAAYICDDRLLIKPVPSAVKLLPNARYEAPYDGAKEMLLAEDTDNKDFLKEFFKAIYPELPEPKKKK